MNLDEFQESALRTDNTKQNYEDQESQKDLVVALLGIAGELGTLSTAYKKFLRDGPAFKPYRDNIKEELGDLLWYVAVLAHKFGLSLSEIASFNLTKTRGRWGTAQASFQPSYDATFPPEERLPRKFEILFQETNTAQGSKLSLILDGEILGDPLTDNSAEEDGYRFHDAFHLAFAATLGWSPVLRKLLRRKRRSNSKIDENEDGGRALVIEEGIVAYVFEYGQDHDDLRNVRAVDFEVLKTAKNMTHRLEVQSKSWSDWEKAIKSGFFLFRKLKENRGGIVSCDLDTQTVSYRSG